MASTQKMKWRSRRSGGRVDSYQGAAPGPVLGRDAHRYDYQIYQTGVFGKGPEGWKLLYRGAQHRDSFDALVGDEEDLGIFDSPQLAKKAAQADFAERNRAWDPGLARKLTV